MALCELRRSLEEILSRFCILQVIKNWSRERPGNEATQLGLPLGLGLMRIRVPIGNEVGARSADHVHGRVKMQALRLPSRDGMLLMAVVVVFLTCCNGSKFLIKSDNYTRMPGTSYRSSS